MCLIRKSGEAATKPDEFMPELADFEGTNLVRIWSLLCRINLSLQQFYPSTYKTVLANSKIAVGAVCDFANSTFDDFRDLSEISKVK